MANPVYLAGLVEPYAIDFFYAKSYRLLLIASICTGDYGRDWGYLVIIQPDSPNSPTQKYYLTELGKALLENDKIEIK